MYLSTTPTIEGKKIVKHIGLVDSDTVSGINVVRDIFAGIRDIFGGRSATYERGLKEGKEQALIELTKKAEGLGANAIVGIDYDYETMGANGGMLMVNITGTAVVVE